MMRGLYLRHVPGAQCERRFNRLPLKPSYPSTLAPLFRVRVCAARVCRETSTRLGPDLSRAYSLSISRGSPISSQITFDLCFTLGLSSYKALPSAGGLSTSRRSSGAPRPLRDHWHAALTCWAIQESGALLCWRSLAVEY